MSLIRHMADDFVRAFAVLALVFLSYGHLPALATGTHGHDLLTAAVDTSWCGDQPADATHAPCHACRVLGTALPPPEGGLIHRPLCAAFAPEASSGVAITPMPPGLPDARGPPHLA